MARSKAATVREYLDGLPEKRRAVLNKVRKVIVQNLPKGYTEAMNWGMISYELPLSVYPDSPNGQPLSYAALAAQKHYYAVHLTGAYVDPKQAAYLVSEFKKRGKKLDMGKSCLRFNAIDDLALDVIGTVIASTPPDALIARMKAIRAKKSG